MKFWELGVNSHSGFKVEKDPNDYKEQKEYQKEYQTKRRQKARLLKNKSIS